MNSITMNTLRLSILNASTKLLSLQRLQVIPQRSLIQFVAQDRQAPPSPPVSCKIDQNKYTGHLNYEARRYIARMPPTKPITFPNSGELDSSLEYLDPSQPKPGFNVPELERSSDAVKKVFSIGFANGRAVKEQRLDNILNQVKEHPADVASLEVKIAKMTIEIRTQMKHLLSCRKDKLSKRMLHERIQKRRSWIHDLRKIDMEKFDWLLKHLKIKYIPYVEYDRKLGKRALAKKAAREKFLAVKKEKLEEFRQKLEKEREAFDKVKAHELQAIEAELKSFGIEKFKSVEDTLHALKDGKPLGPRVKRRAKNRELLLAKKFELYKHKREDSLKD